MIHFGIAVAILGYTLWLLFGLRLEGQVGRLRARSSAVWIAGLMLSLILLQLLAGALVAGLDAGMGYNTWPLINGAFVPEGLGTASPWYLNLFENGLTVQFNHRMLAYALVLATLAQAIWLGLRGAPQILFGTALTLAVLTLMQATLGVWTLLLAVPITLGLAHQAGAIAVFVVALYHFWLTLHAPEGARAAQTEANA
jgi:cytochrome c oxidase assembly protein subunit 15